MLEGSENVGKRLFFSRQVPVALESFTHTCLSIVNKNNNF